MNTFYFKTINSNTKIIVVFASRFKLSNSKTKTFFILFTFVFKEKFLVAQLRLLIAPRKGLLLCMLSLGFDQSEASVGFAHLFLLTVTLVQFKL